jgi:hypothetical protein
MEILDKPLLHWTLVLIISSWHGLKIFNELLELIVLFLSHKKRSAGIDWEIYVAQVQNIANRYNIE